MKKLNRRTKVVLLTAAMAMLLIAVYAFRSEEHTSELQSR